MITSKYKGEEVDTGLSHTTSDDNVFCLNDDCDGLEVHRDLELGDVAEVTRVAYHLRRWPVTRTDPEDWEGHCPACGDEEVGWL